MKNTDKKPKSRKKKKKIKILIFVIIYELIAVMYCTTGIFIISMDHTEARHISALTRDVTEATEASTIVADVKKGAKAYDKWLAEEEEKNRWKGPILTRSAGAIYGPSGKETYYNLNMNGVISIMRNMGYTGEYWVREDGCKMLGDYIMVAANLNLRPRGSIVETSLGQGIVCDTGGFAKRNPYQIDIAVTW